jgi:hypothetical protein
MDWSIKEIRYSPICLIRDAEEDCYYIADGNHRFFTKLLVHKSKSINAWVLKVTKKSLMETLFLPD